MNSYYDDEPPNAPRGQARMPGGERPGPSDDGYDPFDPFADDHGAGPGGYAGGGHAPPPAPTTPASGRASVGRASIRPPTQHGPYGDGSGIRPGGDAFDDGFDPFAGEESLAPAPPGRAPVPPAAGRAGVGRATVPGGPPGPGGPRGPRTTGPGGPGGPGGDAKAAAKKARRRNRIIAGFAASIMLLGLLVVIGTYYSASIPLPADQQLPQSTTLYYADGKTVMARIGEENRVLITLDQVPMEVRHAVVATEDETFYTNIGVDFKGIARAFVNNITGGQTQGASTITQQYARNLANLTYSASYARKMKEIVIAIKLSNKYTKQQILEDYLNTVLFGRGAYGIEAAALAYFNKHASQLTMAEGMVLAGLIKDPNGGIYDPATGLATAKARWDYTRGQMYKLHYMTKQQYDTIKYPTDYTKPKDLVGSEMDTSTGFIIHHVMSELSQATVHGKPVFPATGPNSLKNGGYQIVTTIDKNAQDAAVRYASGSDPKSPMRDVKPNIGAALVAVQPGTGRVIAYYGGKNGAGIDRAGIYNDPVLSEPGWSGANQIPGSSFKTVTMATALQQHLSINSYWYGPEVLPVQGRPPVSNVKGEYCSGAQQICPMWEGLKKSLNTMFYQIGVFQDQQSGIKMTPGKIVNMAYDLGIQNIWPGDHCGGKRIPLNGHNGEEVTATKNCITPEVSFGEYGIAVQDMANVIATYAASGVRATEHFVDHVSKGTGDNNSVVYKASWTVQLKPVPNMNGDQWNDLTWAMQQVYKNSNERANQLAGGREAAAKTGTWQLSSNASQNGWVFFNGFTAHGAGKPAGSNGQIAVTAMVTYTGSKPTPVQYKNGHNIPSHGAPAKLWQLFVDAYEANGPGHKPFPIEKFAPPSNTGDPTIGGTPSPVPTQPSPTDGCLDPQLCLSGQPTLPGPTIQPTTQPSANPLTIKVSKGFTPQTARLNWNNSGQGAVTIDWGDGSSDTGNDQGQRTHSYPTPGDYTITVTDADDPTRTDSKQITVPFP